MPTMTTLMTKTFTETVTLTDENGRTIQGVTSKRASDFPASITADGRTLYWDVWVTNGWTITDN